MFSLACSQPRGVPGGFKQGQGVYRCADGAYFEGAPQSYVGPGMCWLSEACAGGWIPALCSAPSLAASTSAAGEFKADDREGTGTHYYVDGRAEVCGAAPAPHSVPILAQRCAGAAQVGTYIAGADAGVGARWSADRRTARA